MSSGTLNRNAPVDFRFRVSSSLMSSFHHPFAAPVLPGELGIGRGVAEEPLPFAHGRVDDEGWAGSRRDRELVGERRR